MILIIVGILIVVLVLYVIVSYNALVREKNKVKTNWAQIDVVLKRRADLIPNLVETVKGYAKHEKETLDSVMQARNTYMNASIPSEQMEAAGELTQALNKIMAISEAYPDLKEDLGLLSAEKSVDVPSCAENLSTETMDFTESVTKFYAVTDPDVQDLPIEEKPILQENNFVEDKTVNNDVISAKTAALAEKFSKL